MKAAEKRDIARVWSITRRAAWVNL